jgi:hypothetical protein
MNDHEQQQKIIENYIAAYNNFDVETMLKNLDAHVVFRNVSNGEVDFMTNGIDEFRRQAEESARIFSEREQKITGFDFVENSVEAAISYKGKIGVDLPNGLKAGDEIALEGKSVFRFAGEKIVEIADIS